MSENASFIPNRDWWPLFSTRYGLASEIHEPWGHLGIRHNEKDHIGDGIEGCNLDPRKNCVCPGGPARQGCCLAASQEDRLCDACRDWCVAQDFAGTEYRLVDVYKPPCSDTVRP